MVLNLEISDVLNITQTIGIIATLLLALYFSRRQIKDLSVDTETKVLIDLDEKMHRLEEHLSDDCTFTRTVSRLVLGFRALVLVEKVLEIEEAMNHLLKHFEIITKYKGV
jgi:hypothetical protein